MNKMGIPLGKYQLLVLNRICIRKDHKWFGRRWLIVHILKDNCNWKWFYIPLWKYKPKR